MPKRNISSPPTLESLTQDYLLHCRAEAKSPATIRIYSLVLANFAWYCRRQNFPDPAALTGVHIRQFLWYLASEPERWDSANPASRKQVTSTTVHDYFRALRTFFNWLQREEFLTCNPFANLKPPKTAKKVIQALTTIEIDRLFNTCSKKSAMDFRNHAILSVFLDTGLRVAELSSLSVSDLTPADGTILVRHGKGGKQRVVRIGSRAQKSLWRYLHSYRRGNSDALFLNHRGEPLSLFGIKILVNRLGVKAGLKVHPHKLRHTFAISFLRAGGDVFSLRYLLGHSTLAMTQRYLGSLDAGDATKAHEKFSPLDNLNKRTNS